MLEKGVNHQCQWHQQQDYAGVVDTGELNCLFTASAVDTGGQSCVGNFVNFRRNFE
jgi:hypothetical protein